jgi:5'-nucleotidase
MFVMLNPDSGYPNLGFGTTLKNACGRPVDPAVDYRITVNSYLAEGGDGLRLLREGRERLGGELDVDALAAYLQTGPAPDRQPRITVVE